MGPCVFVCVRVCGCVWACMYAFVRSCVCVGACVCSCVSSCMRACVSGYLEFIKKFSLLCLIFINGLGGNHFIFNLRFAAISLVVSES